LHRSQKSCPVQKAGQFFFTRNLSIFISDVSLPAAKLEEHKVLLCWARTDLFLPAIRRLVFIQKKQENSNPAI